jgi:hypothetical protein
MFLKERVRFIKLNGTRGYRHDATPFLLKISIMRLHDSESILNTNACQERQLMPRKRAVRPFIGRFRADVARARPGLARCSVGCVQFFTWLLCKKMNKAKLRSNP